MATHSSILAWRIPRTEESGRLQSMALQRVRHDLATQPQQQSTARLPFPYMRMSRVRHLRADLVAYGATRDGAHSAFPFSHA